MLLLGKYRNMHNGKFWDFFHFFGIVEGSPLSEVDTRRFRPEVLRLGGFTRGMGSEISEVYIYNSKVCR